MTKQKFLALNIFSHSIQEGKNILGIISRLHNSNYEIQGDSRRFTNSIIQETTISQGNSRRVGTITSKDLENVSMCHTQTQTGKIHL